MTVRDGHYRVNPETLSRARCLGEFPTLPGNAHPDISGTQASLGTKTPEELARLGTAE